jgi:hypothetical protein
MGDRCYVQLICRKEDAPRFEAIAFNLQDENAGPGLVEMTDHERNGGTCYGEDWPTDIPYTGSAGNGDQYDGCEFACDGKEYREVSTGIQGGYLVEWDAKLNEPGDRSLAAIRLYHDVNERACELLGMRDPAAAKMEPLTDTKMEGGAQ